MPRTNARGRGRGQFFEAESEAKDKILASRPACPRGLNITGSMLETILPQNNCRFDTIPHRDRRTDRQTVRQASGEQI